MGRSNREQADKNRQRIVDETSATMRGSGVGAVSISEIMARVGMTPGGFYNHFASKEALIAEACSSGFARSAENWRAKTTSHKGSVTGTLNRLISYYFASKPIEKTCPMVALGQDAAPHHASEGFSQAYREGVEQLFTTFADIAHADASCSLSRQDLVVVFAAMVGANMLARSTGDRTWAAEVERVLVMPHGHQASNV
ncbi:TetR family transcriptional regulator [Paraburkholderia sp. 1N]|uniref:TetR family transcriptional regulator n=1 Tax=Paraburkholderia solitsugae TaxID=2675748 RepID=A0ABX2C2N8_9BURK|nr:TetR/AcrR family transcriptional regulator [Paraburkholderia solitsugae]NPT46508.1 TetR family transcriptional regulator [Paraburkholderia solitsugae]